MLTDIVQKIEISDLINDDQLDTLEEQQIQVFEQKNQQRVKQWRSSQFKDFLDQYIRNKYLKNDFKISNKLAGRIYKRMYKQYVFNNEQISQYKRFLMHPDLLISDYEFIVSTKQKYNYYVAAFQIPFNISLLTIYHKTSLGLQLKQNKIFGGIFMVFMPFTILFFSLKKSESLLHEKFKLMGYYQKYSISKIPIL